MPDTHVSLGRAWELLDSTIESITAAHPGIQRIEAAGDIRRAEPVVSTLVLVVGVADPAAALKPIAVALGAGGATIKSTNPGELTIEAMRRSARIEIRLTTPAAYGNALFHATGSEAHVHDVVARGLPKALFPTEEQLYASVGLTFIAPELRHATGEIEAAAARRLPALIETSDIRGDLHMHSLYSDGRDPVSEMIAECVGLGYEYMAITDHSWGSAAARTLSRETIEEQREEIHRLRDQFPQIAILHGAEVDILPDGRLDFPDSLLEQFDIVLASLHDGAGHDGARLTRRTIQAIEHPLVNIVCHPANRMAGRVSGYELDFDAVYAAAAETGTALEVDGAPSHLDLDGEHARAAVAAGVTLTIDSDCHRVDALGRQMAFGVGTARRGWVEATSVLNTRSLGDVRAFIAAKRSKSG